MKRDRENNKNSMSRVIFFSVFKEKDKNFDKVVSEIEATIKSRLQKKKGEI